MLSTDQYCSYNIYFLEYEICWVTFLNRAGKFLQGFWSGIIFWLFQLAEGLYRTAGCTAGFWDQYGNQMGKKAPKVKHHHTFKLGNIDDLLTNALGTPNRVFLSS